MKQHLGFTKTKAQANAQAVCVNGIPDYDMKIQDNSIPSTMKQIQKQIADLQAQIAAFTVSKGEKAVRNKVPNAQRAKPKESQPVSQKQSSAQFVTTKRPRPWYCFKCGEDGHIISSCSNPANPVLVDAKRKELKEKQQAWDEKTASKRPLHFKLEAVPVEGRSGTEKQKSPQEKLKTKAILKEQKVKQAGSVPKGLVGRKSTANVEVGGVGCNCLLDTGSQVTTISQSFYNDHLLEYIIKPVSDILEVEGANGEPVPYAGYVEISLKFPKEFIASEPEVENSSFDSTRHSLNSSIPVLIGTNTLEPSL